MILVIYIIAILHIFFKFLKNNIGILNSKLFVNRRIPLRKIHRAALRSRKIHSIIQKIFTLEVPL